MESQPEKGLESKRKKEYTLMIYFASDNPLAISSVSQLKAIKSAPHHEEANVIVHYDPVAEGTPTHVFDVNRIKKLQTNGHSQGNNHNANRDQKEEQPFFPHSLIEDKLWLDEKTRNGEKSIREAIAELVKGYYPPLPPNGKKGNGKEPGPRESLEKFLNFCAESYPAKHYLLFILGHGVVVGNDVFLFDDNAEEPTLKLKQLGNLLRKFRRKVTDNGGNFDFVGFHSCSVSSLEVAFELQGTADYMAASQGTAFVGSWPYTQIIDQVVNETNEKSQPNDIKPLLSKIFNSCLYNSADFLLAGYSFDLCLWNLKKISSIKTQFGALSETMTEALKDAVCRDLIILAHWQSQSFFQEMYTDLYDFCFCLGRKIQDWCLSLSETQSSFAENLKRLLETRPILAKKLKDLFDACENMKTVLEEETPTRNGRTTASDDRLIVLSEFAGPEYQYSHGISLYFPWSDTTTVRRTFEEEYKRYKLTKGFRPEQQWLTFLEGYLKETKRKTRAEELPASIDPKTSAKKIREKDLHEDMINLVYTQEGPSNGQNALDQRAKTDPKDPTGGDCSCPSIKNYPNDTRPIEERRIQAPEKLMSLSENYYQASSA